MNGVSRKGYREILSHYEFSVTTKFSGLDSLRCLSVLLVVWFHTGNKISPSSIGILNHGYLGVTLFFVISGFLITTLLLRELKFSGEIDLKKFFVRRALRIFPLYYLTILLYCFVVAVFENDTPAGNEFWRNLPFFITYTSNYFVELHDARVIFYFSWSLATEEQFYLLWPIALKFLGVRNAIAIPLCLVTLVYIDDTALRLHDFIRYIIDAGGHFPIALGVLSALAMHNQFLYKRLVGVLNFPYAPCVYVLLLVVIVQFDFAPELVSPIIMVLLVLCLVVLKLPRSGNIVGHMTGYLGQISYGIYLFHMLCANVIKQVFEYVDRDITPYWYFSLTVVLVVIVASLSFHTFESYFLSKKKKYQSVQISRPR